ncbi:MULTISPECIES: hypothetical protein [Deinococcus]|uniref:Uncharacterized protein n=1 Tax=Deinococcus marmoris TaxID=249408 RepID=A0A1U7P2A9_9DEIO|nr:hypothetical protein [Deinococcus marmoris]OLV19301.1 hypothetical protein BOO71_0003085 [Deinococcus marmoris]
MNAPVWRVWLVTALVCGWGILTIRFVTTSNWPLAIVSLVLAVFNAYTLYQLTRKGK